MGIPVEKVKTILQETKSVIVHCASFAKMYSDVVNDNSPSGNLINVIKNQLAISCSTIRPGDSFIDKNYTGRMGLILLPNSDCAISHTSHEDAGTSWKERNNGQRENRSVNYDKLLKSINDKQRIGINELCIYNYKVVGFFYDEMPITFTPICNEDGTITAIVYKPKEIYEIFKGINVFELCNGIFYETQYVKGMFQKGKKVNVLEIYNNF